MQKLNNCTLIHYLYTNAGLPFRKFAHTRCDEPRSLDQMDFSSVTPCLKHLGGLMITG